MAASKTLSPEQRRERSRNAGLAAHSVDAAIRRLVEKAPELTEEQKSQLRTLLGR